ncbi:MAG: amidohydrolase family protein [Ilumatobacteraceae bacterium]|nr:amidohydrolase family protein [Ilumatobacteraceae bacterium]
MLIRNARLADGRHVDIETRDGVIVAVTPSGSPAPEAAADAEVHDLGGWLLLPAMAEPHAHLDKALTAEAVPNPTGDLRGAIEAWVAAAEAGLFTHDDMVVRVRAALDKLLLNGVTAVRSHINCGSGSGITHLLAAQEAVADFEGLMHVEFVALTHSPMSGEGSDANRAALRQALDRGVDLVGGCPHLEPDGVGSIQVALDAAESGGVPVDLHVDETLDPTMLTLRDLARAVIDRGLEGRVAASHCVSLGMQTPEVQAAVAGEVAAAGIAIVPLPQTNLFLQGRDHVQATPRGLTAIAALRDAGVLIAAGGDNVQDPFNLVGRSDPLETAALLVMAGHVLPDDAYDMVSNNVRRAMRLPTVRFDVGDPADFVAIDAASIREAIADAPADRKVFHRGRLVAASSTDRAIHR